MQIRMKTSGGIILLFCALFIYACKGGGGNSSNSQTQDGSTQTTGEKTDSLLAALNARIASNPDDYTGYLERAKYFGEKLEYGKAYEDLARAIKADSTKGDIYAYKGELHFRQGNDKSAYEAYSRGLHFDSLHVNCLLKKTGLDIVLGNYDLARGQINTALRVNEYNPEAYYMRGRLYKTLGDTNIAASSYKTAIEVDRNYYDAYVEVGLLYAARKNDLAKEYYSSAIDIRPRSVEAWYNKAIYLQETGFRKKDRYKEAFACYDSILKIEPRFVAADFNKGYIWLEYMQGYDSAAYYFTRAIGNFPDYYQAFYNRGLCLESLGKRGEAEKDYRQALAIRPDYTEAAKALNRVLSGK